MTVPAIIALAGRGTLTPGFMRKVPMGRQMPLKSALERAPCRSWASLAAASALGSCVNPHYGNVFQAPFSVSEAVYTTSMSGELPSLGV